MKWSQVCRKDNRRVEWGIAFQSSNNNLPFPSSNDKSASMKNDETRRDEISVVVRIAERVFFFFSLPPTSSSRGCFQKVSQISTLKLRLPFESIRFTKYPSSPFLSHNSFVKFLFLERERDREREIYFNTQTRLFIFMRWMMKKKRI